MHASCFLKGELILGRADTLLWHQTNRWQGNLKRLKGYKKGNRTRLKILCFFLMSPSSYESEEKCVTITISRPFFSESFQMFVFFAFCYFYLIEVNEIPFNFSTFVKMHANFQNYLGQQLFYNTDKSLKNANREVKFLENLYKLKSFIFTINKLLY